MDPITAALAAVGIGGAGAGAAATGLTVAGADIAALGPAAATTAAATAAGAGAGAGAGLTAGGGLTTALTAASLAGTVGSTIMGVRGQQQTSAAQAASANYQAQVAANNQIIAQQNARYAQQAGAANAQAQDFKTRKLLGEEMAAQGASGIDLTTGTPVDVTQSSRALGRLDTANIVQQANLASYGYGTQATGYGATAALERQQAGYAQQAGGIGVAGTLLGGATSFATKWAQFQQRGVIGSTTGAGGI